MTITLGTHNLHDTAGRPTFFADVLLFTEAVPELLREHLSKGYDLRVCGQQRSLAIAYRTDVFEPHRQQYRMAHGGTEKVTPHRGTFGLHGELASGRPLTLLVEHRINAAFVPFVRGEARLRADHWRTHTFLTLDWAAELKRAGDLVLAGGDTNTPHGFSAYRGALPEVGRGYDRLAGSPDIDLIRPEYLGKAGSDHPRLRATVKGV